MNRKQFLKTSILALIGSQFPLNSEIFKSLNTDAAKIQQLLGLDQSHLVSEDILLEGETYDAFCQMKSKATEDGIQLEIVSAYRSFESQKEIWERKFKKLKRTKTPQEAISEIITYSSIPGTSRHHWGTDIDLIDTASNIPDGDVLLEKHYHGDGPFSKMKSWMQKHSQEFGFELVYTNDVQRTGFNYEPWHYSYRPKSLSFLKVQSQRSFIEEWKKLEFEGKEYLTEDFIASYFKNYNWGINPSLTPS
jgi:LAS superfamily LD-carboxypeptidase LdcB